MDPREKLRRGTINLIKGLNERNNSSAVKNNREIESWEEKKLKNLLICLVEKQKG